MIKSAYMMLMKQIEQAEETKDYIEGEIAMAYILHCITAFEWESLNKKLASK